MVISPNEESVYTISVLGTEISSGMEKEKFA